MVNFYSQGCPKCKVLQTKLDQKSIDYSIIEDFDISTLESNGIKSLPALEVDGQWMKFEDAIKWLREM